VPLAWLGVLLVGLILGTGHVAAAESKKFTLINVLLDGTKIWLPSSVIVQQGDEVEITLINKLEDPHGFKIEAFGIEELVQPKAQITVKFTASKAGAQNYICHIHPPHIGGQILVLSK
jgi:plastocyanin